MSRFQSAKKLLRRYMQAMEEASASTATQVLAEYTSADYSWRGVFPFREQDSGESAARVFWQPLMHSFTRLQRREDIFMAGENVYDGETWVMSSGNFMGLFDNDFLGIPATRRIANLRYAEFSCVRDGKICQTGLFVDLIGLMVQAGVNPLPPSTGVYYNYPGPRYHDGLLHDEADPADSEITLSLVNTMVQDLSDLNTSGAMGCPPEVLARTWHEDMLWYGPAGIGASYTIPRYQEQHQLPFRNQLGDKQFQGHVCRFAEGNYACFFGWPNLSNSPLGGWLGLPGGSQHSKMQVVDIYRREGDKLVENWILIDLPWWLTQQGLDVLQRNRELRGVM
ncbi:nuclear transport factor 2 family protein [Granulosicoccus antarcticus]|uniref:Uncharacterized protein n=1 Tax=Granulosicoccus antarcticus IMCC3135 TaxID=1192854 RepID=A0A2Z2NSD5_9GAMM|nr:nuclear transport factor 2 family protein [Granulosicoccus antarcticus]ASJ74233.1 hypothetical protein IMCC3135_20780 [Granulosicoccus antarcticus IMCC3135]